jgi:hypothetical protein
LDTVQYLICCRAAIWIHCKQYLQERIQLLRKVGSHPSSIVETSPACNFRSKLIQVFLFFVDDVRASVWQLRKAQEVKNHSQRKYVRFEREVSEWPIRVLAPKDLGRAIGKCPCRTGRFAHCVLGLYFSEIAYQYSDTITCFMEKTIMGLEVTMDVPIHV